METIWNEDEELLFITVNDESFPTRELMDKWLPKTLDSTPFPEHFCGTAEDDYLARVFVALWSHPDLRYYIPRTREKRYMWYSWDHFMYAEEDKLQALGIFLRFTDWDMDDMLEAQSLCSDISSRIGGGADTIAYMCLIALAESDMFLGINVSVFWAYMLGAYEAKVKVRANKLEDFSQACSLPVFQNQWKSDQIIAGFINHGLTAVQINDFMTSEVGESISRKEIDTHAVIQAHGYDPAKLLETIPNMPASILEELYPKSMIYS